VLIDPTLVLTSDEWRNLLDLKSIKFEKKTIVAYFLDEPSEKAKNLLCYFSKHDYQIISLLYKRKGAWFDFYVNAGPTQFLQYIINADIIVTDSFHGTAFSILFKKDFYVFERMYKGSEKQSTRIDNLLKKLGLSNRYDTQKLISDQINYDACDDILNVEREKAKKYLKNSIEEI